MRSECLNLNFSSFSLKAIRGTLYPRSLPLKRSFPCHDTVLWKCQSYFKNKWIKNDKVRHHATCYEWRCYHGKKENPEYKGFLRIQPDICFLLEIHNLHLMMAIFFFFCFRTMDVAQNKLCKVTSTRFTTSVIILSVSCDPLKPSHREGRGEIWPFPKNVFFQLFSLLF